MGIVYVDRGNQTLPIINGLFNSQGVLTKITVFGGTGNTGAVVVAEADRRGHYVTSVSRSGRPVPGTAENISANLADTERVVQLVAKADVAIFAISPDRTGGPVQPTIDAYQALINARPQGRLIVVGGAGCLLDANGNELVDDPSFPESFRPGARAFSQILKAFREAGDAFDWTFVSPAPAYPGGDSTGSYILGTDTPVGLNLSVADFALALLDEAEKPAHGHMRFTVAAAS